MESRQRIRMGAPNATEDRIENWWEKTPMMIS